MNISICLFVMTLRTVQAEWQEEGEKQGFNAGNSERMLEKWASAKKIL